MQQCFNYAHSAFVLADNARVRGSPSKLVYRQNQSRANWYRPPYCRKIGADHGWEKQSASDIETCYPGDNLKENIYAHFSLNHFIKTLNVWPLPLFNEYKQNNSTSPFSHQGLCSWRAIAPFWQIMDPPMFTCLLKERQQWNSSQKHRKIRQSEMVRVRHSRGPPFPGSAIPAVHHSTDHNPCLLTLKDTEMSTANPTPKP